ncbi:MAG TPA: FAD-binding protein, partial [Candidatus Limnocylindrales bacterium]
MSASTAPAAPTDAARGAFLDAVRATLPNLRLLTDPTDRESYRLDETTYLTAGLPLAVALPESTADVSALVRLASEHRIPIVPRGAGTGLSGGAAGIEGGITIAFTKMNRILELDRPNLCVVVQPGILNADLKRAVAAEGLFYPPDPASYEICSIGGNLGTNAGGLCCIKYGQTRDNVLGLEVVLADGTVIRTGGRNVKDVAGYALTHLFIGSQGTLGLITEATLRLRPAPSPHSTMLAFFPTLDSAGDAVAAMAVAGISLVTLELMDKATIA